MALGIYDKRGNLIEGIYHRPGNPSEQIVEQYVYDATNRMVKGVNEEGEESHYIFNGLGYLIANEWVIEKNAYGYTNNMNTNQNDRVNISNPNGQTQDVVVCDRHTNTTGLGHINPTGKGHTEGGTTGAAPPNINHGKYIVVHKDYVLDYTDPLKSVIIETESREGNLTYRYVYGLEKAHVVIYGIQGGAGSIMTYGMPPDPEPDAAIVDYAFDEETGIWEAVSEAEFFLSEIMEFYSYGSSNGGGGGIMPLSSPAVTGIVKLYYHHDRLGTTDYLSDNVAGGVISYVTYDDWGALTAKAVLKTGVRELDLVQQYTVHPMDMVLGMYFAQARIYDAQDRRFMAVDPLKGTIANPQTLNLYLYVLDNPIKFTDPFGLWGEKVHAGLDENATRGTAVWARELGISEKDVITLSKANSAVDSFTDWYSFINEARPSTSPYLFWSDYATSWHFDTNLGVVKDSRQERFDEQYLKAVQAYLSGSVEEAMIYLGRGLHALQDMMAHQKWLEIGGRGIPHFVYYESFGCVEIDAVTGKPVINYYNTDNPFIDAAFDNPSYDIFLEYRKIEQTVTNRRGKTVTVSWYESVYVARPGGQRLAETKRLTEAAILRFMNAVNYTN